MRVFRKYRVYAAVLVAVICAIAIVDSASATVGDTELCVDVVADNAAGVQGIDTNDLMAQTFTPSSNFNLGAIKANFRGFGDSTTALIEITETSGGDPDLNNILGQEVLDLSTIPLLVGGNNPYSCSSSSDVSQIVEFTPAIALSSGSTYAIVVSYNSGTPSGSTVVAFPYTVPAPGSPEYSGGFPVECEVPASCTPTTPATWDLVNSCSNCSFSFTLFDNVVTTTENDIDSWLTNFLTGIGMNGAFGRVLVGSLFAMFVFLILTVKGVPWIISLGIGGLGITFLTAATLLSESILLGMVAIILVGGMGLIMALMSGGNRDG